MRLVRDGQQIQIEAVVTFLIIFRARMNIILTSKSDSRAH
jgi:hypothetical protein